MTAFNKARFENAKTVAEFDDLFDAASQEYADDFYAEFIAFPDNETVDSDGYVVAWLQRVGLGDLRQKIEVRENEEV